MTNLTPLELAALHNLMNSDYGNPCWDWCATGGLVTKKNVGGVVASLSKKDLVTCDGEGQDATIFVTPAGQAAYEESRRG